MQNPVFTQDPNLYDIQEMSHQFQMNPTEEEIHRIEKKEVLLEDKLRVFPVFGDYKLSSYSANHLLYLEFFRIVLRILGRLLLLIVFMNLIDFFFWTPAFVNDVGQSEDEMIAICIEVIEDQYGIVVDQSDQEVQDCVIGFEEAEPYIVLSKEYFWRMVGASVTSGAIIMFLIYAQIQEEERVIKNPLLFDLNWTQDLFSVLLENIPQNVTQEELKTYLESQQPLKKANRCVKEIILVQDYQKCLELSKQIKNLEKFISANRESQNIELSQEIRRPSETINSNQNDRTDNYETNKDIETSNKTSLVFEGESREQLNQLSELKDALIREKSALSPHNGKAIVVLDSIHTKTLVIKMFTPSIWDYLRRIWRGSKQQATLREGHLIAKDLPEPSDLLSENLYYPEQKNILRQVLVCTVALVLIIGGSFLTWGLQIVENLSETQENQKEAFNEIWNSGSGEPSTIINIFNISLGEELMISVLLMIVESTAAFLFRFMNRSIKQISKLKVDTDFVYFSMFSSFLIYLFIQGAFMVFQAANVESIAQITISLLCVRYIIEKLAKAYISKKYRLIQTKNPGEAPNTTKKVQISCLKYWILKCVLGVLIHLDMENLHFNFLDETTRAFPLIILNFAFTANGAISAPTVLPSESSRSIIPLPMILTFLALYLGVICDKYRLIAQHEDRISNSGSNMFKSFKFFRYDQFACILGSMIWIFNYEVFISNLLNLISQTEDTTASQILESFIPTLSPSFYEVMISLFIFFLLCLLIWPSYASFEKRFQALFFINQGNVEYDQVASNFTSLYRKLDLDTCGHNLNNTKNTIL